MEVSQTWEKGVTLNLSSKSVESVNLRVNWTNSNQIFWNWKVRVSILRVNQLSDQGWTQSLLNLLCEMAPDVYFLKLQVTHTHTHTDRIQKLFIYSLHFVCSWHFCCKLKIKSKLIQMIMLLSVSDPPPKFQHFIKEDEAVWYRPFSMFSVSKYDISNLNPPSLLQTGFHNE